jgi:hypothetical protein
VRTDQILILALLSALLGCAPQPTKPERFRRYTKTLGIVTETTVQFSGVNVKDVCQRAHREELAASKSKQQLYFVFAYKEGSDQSSLYFGLQVDEMSARDHFLWYQSKTGKTNHAGTCELIALGSKVLSQWHSDEAGHSTPPRILKVRDLGLGEFSPTIDDCEIMCVKFGGALDRGPSFSFAHLYLRHPEPRIVFQDPPAVSRLVAALGWSNLDSGVLVSSSGFSFTDTRFPVFLPSVRFGSMTAESDQRGHYEESWYFPPHGSPRFGSRLHGVGFSTDK